MANDCKYIQKHLLRICVFHLKKNTGVLKISQLAGDTKRMTEAAFNTPPRLYKKQACVMPFTMSNSLDMVQAPLAAGIKKLHMITS